MATTILLNAADGNGDALSQANLSTYFNTLARSASFIVSGFELHSDGAGLDIDVNAGTAFVNGFYVNYSTNVTGQACTASMTNYVWLEPDGDLEIETTGTATDTNALLLGTVVCDGSGVTSVSHVQDITNGYNVLRRKTADEADTDGVPDNDLQFAVSAREVWHVKILAIYSGSDGVAKMQYGFGIPSGGIVHAGYGPNDDDYTASALLSGQASANAYSHTGATSTSNDVTIDTSVTTLNIAKISALVFIGTTGGTFTWRWGRGGASGNITVKAGSYLYARRVFG